MIKRLASEYDSVSNQGSFNESAQKIHALIEECNQKIETNEREYAEFDDPNNKTVKDLARVVLKRIENAKFNFALCYTALADICFKQNNYDDAIKYYQMAIDNYPEREHARDNSYNYLLLKCAEAQLRLNPNDETVSGYLSVVENVSNQYTRASSVLNYFGVDHFNVLCEFNKAMSDNEDNAQHFLQMLMKCVNDIRSKYKDEGKIRKDDIARVIDIAGVLVAHVEARNEAYQADKAIAELNPAINALEAILKDTSKNKSYYFKRYADAFADAIQALGFQRAVAYGKQGDVAKAVVDFSSLKKKGYEYSELNIDSLLRFLMNPQMSVDNFKRVNKHELYNLVEAVVNANSVQDDTKINFLRTCINPASALGKVFYRQDGVKACSLNSGTLKHLWEMLVKLNPEEPKPVMRDEGRNKKAKDNEADNKKESVFDHHNKF